MSQERRMTDGGRIRVSPGAAWEQDPIEAADPGATNRDAEPVDDDTARDLSRAVEALEAVDWGDVPTVSTATAAVFARLLRLALERGRSP